MSDGEGEEGENGGEGSQEGEEEGSAADEEEEESENCFVLNLLASLFCLRTAIQNKQF